MLVAVIVAFLSTLSIAQDGVELMDFSLFLSFDWFSMRKGRRALLEASRVVIDWLELLVSNLLMHIETV